MGFSFHQFNKSIFINDSYFSQLFAPLKNDKITLYAQTYWKE